jgi:CheY-like chemotaxis protein/HPt (histidine-containing phosphotransfer) domain-containing protein
VSARILAVEDTPALRALLQLCLTRAGYLTDMAEEGQSAVDMFITGEYDAVVMDIQMPVMDGLAAVARMREWEAAEKRTPIPILALTANTEPADLRKCLQAGFTVTVRKPFAREDLLAAVARELDPKPQPPAGERILVKIDQEYAELIPQFLENCQNDVAAMRKALEFHDYPAIAAAGHRLTGTGASFGFEPLSDEGRILEVAAKASDDAVLRKSLDAIGAYLASVSVVYS